MLGALRAAAIASSMRLGVSTAPAGSATMQPFCAPCVRRWRVSLRVSIPAIATVPSRSRYFPSVIVMRKLDSRTGRSLITRPAACTFGASMSSSLTP